MSEPTKRGVSTVMRRMQTFIQDENTYSPEFVSVAGDNYYPNKPEKKTKDKSAEKKSASGEKEKKLEKPKQKVIIKSELVSGFACLESLDVPVNVIMGNHDLETNLRPITSQSDTFLYTESGLYFGTDKTTIIEPANDCPILELEKKTEKKRVELKLDFLGDDIPKFGQNTLVLMIDTSMYETDEKDIAQYEECYPKLEDDLYLSEPLSVIEQLRDRQQFRVINAIEKNSSKQNIVVIGHHPITAYIVKKTEYQLVKPFPQFVELWKAIIAETTGKHLYYLCADKHFYQPGTVKIDGTEIHQYIVGTGGADLDTNPFTNPLVDKQILIKNMKTNIENLTYSMTSRQIWDSYSNYGYGFLVCTETPEKLVFQFVPDTSTPKLREDLRQRKSRAETRNRNVGRPQSAPPSSRSRRSLSRPSSAGGKRTRKLHKLYRRKRK